ncbi:MAG: hypothetical protein IJ158_04210 [Treponema sp.]|nr:hypothetical protein [Treponema sp.]
MEFYSMDELPKAVKSGKLSKKQAARLIWEEVYTHPAEYGLFYFTEDQKSDFLLSIQETFEKLFEKFIPGMISFKTFITGCITNQKNAFLRNQVRREHERRSIDTYLRTKTEEDSEKYEVKLTERPQFDFSHENSKDFSDVIEQEINSQEKKDKRVAELTALVLMMKACKDVDDETVTAVSNFTEVDKSLLYEKLQELKQTLSEKSDSFTTLVKRRNNAFYFHRKYMQEMFSSISTDREIKIIQKKYEGQTKKWKEKNASLASCYEKPSNKEIAKRIGIKPRMVSFYINHAKKNENMSKFQTFYKNKTEKSVEYKLEVDTEDEIFSAKVAENSENQ